MDQPEGMEVTESTRASLEVLVRITAELGEELAHQLKIRPKLPEVTLPFSPVFRPDVAVRPTAIQRLMIKWRNRLKTRNEALRESLELQGREAEIRRFPLAGWGVEPNFGTVMSAQACLKFLFREFKLLEQKITTDLADQTGSTKQITFSENRPATSDELMTAVDVAQRLGVSTQRVYELIRRGSIEAVKIGRRRRVRTAVLDEFIRTGGRGLNT